MRSGENGTVALFGCSSKHSAAIIGDNTRLIIMYNKNIIRIALATAGILLIPLVAMQFTDEVSWDETDFIVMGVLLFGSGLMYELLASRSGTIVYRGAAGIAVATALLLVWMNLAVGLIGSEDNPANLLYIGVLAALVGGIGISRFEPRGMARALFATALAQALVPVIALVIWKPPVTSGVVEVFGVNALFVALWVGSALLFRHASATVSEVSRLK
jgi:hypothetical protein